MARSPNTDRNGKTFSTDTIVRVWLKARNIPGIDPKKRKRDYCGATMEFENYGKQVKTGWEVDHKIPVAKGGTDNLDNLQPLQWENNRHKGDELPGKWSCKVIS